MESTPVTHHSVISYHKAVQFSRDKDSCFKYNIVFKMLSGLYSVLFLFLEVLSLRKQNVHVKNVQIALRFFISEKNAAKTALNA